jgi:hypothetical protein
MRLASVACRSRAVPLCAKNTSWKRCAAVTQEPSRSPGDGCATIQEAELVGSRRRSRQVHYSGSSHNKIRHRTGRVHSSLDLVGHAPGRSIRVCVLEDEPIALVVHLKRFDIVTQVKLGIDRQKFVATEGPRRDPLPLRRGRSGRHMPARTFFWRVVTIPNRAGYRGEDHARARHCRKDSGSNEVSRAHIHRGLSNNPHPVSRCRPA